MAIVNGPIIVESFEVHRDVTQPDHLVLVLTAADGQYGIPLSRSQAQLMAEKLTNAVTTPD